MYRSTTARYGPQGVRNFIEDHPAYPTSKEIATYRFQERFNIRNDSNEQLTTPYVLHTDYIPNQMDRKIAFNDTWSDIQDAVSFVFNI